jgi:O-acetyl-ADP-ribose deacetylase (regulator of RNase III)
MIKIIDGNILNATEDIICHQVNCKGVMGAGLAKQIRNKYPYVYEEYVKLIKWATEEYKRGHSKTDSLLSSCQFVDTPDDKVVANIFGQEGYGRGRIQTDYVALSKGLQSIRESIIDSNSPLFNKSVALPYGIGCGLAGGDWNIIRRMIEEIFNDCEVTLYKL